jgi:hypothetical protein
MLAEGDRLIKPADILEQVKGHSQHFDAVVVLGLGKPGNPNEIWMSTLTINELAMLAQAFQAEMVIRMGAMKEGR